MARRVGIEDLVRARHEALIGVAVLEGRRDEADEALDAAAAALPEAAALDAVEAELRTANDRLRRVEARIHHLMERRVGPVPGRRGSQMRMRFSTRRYPRVIRLRDR